MARLKLIYLGLAGSAFGSWIICCDLNMFWLGLSNQRFTYSMEIERLTKHCPQPLVFPATGVPIFSVWTSIRAGVESDGAAEADLFGFSGIGLWIMDHLLWPEMFLARIS